ncbi:MATE family efflux transporter [Bifidobacterium ramosum]|uniref:Multidrug export protein MepA n=1 Tax=Bifidobacterium ramosum TaxID=1798158 RepID=A0A6L4X3B3_9BIFI|nr:MATE family efflux transporter [Bifidobacterium ramosum]KAB8289284.1 MATE family efflux transporter [Bifidobacterium ramosum]NEG70990.1 MATE family efflux transporter [Bifidobacterium ramosum]
MPTTTTTNALDAGLGTKPVPRLALTMSIPTIVAQGANASYTIIDRLFIGHIPGVGNEAMTGVGVCFPILLAVTAFASLIGAGGAPRASIELGRGNFRKAERILGTSAVFLVAVAVTLTIVLQLAKRPILVAFGASDATIDYAVDFITVYLVGTVFVQLTLGLNNFIAAQGKTTVAMVSVLIGTGTSIALDPLFIFVAGWGVRGAALANVLAQMISTIWIVWFLSSGRSAIRLRPRNIRFDRLILPVLSLGLAPFIMQITECLINVVFNVGLQRYGGDDYVTSITIITSLMQIVSVLTAGFQQGIQPIIGFNFGARDMDRVRQAIRMAFVTQIASATALVSILAAFPGFFAGWFTDKPDVIAIVTTMMPVFVCGWGIFGIQMGVQCALVGMGQAKLSIFLAILRKIILLVPLALILPHWLGVNGIFIAEPISDATSGIVAGVLFCFAYRRIRASLTESITPTITPTAAGTSQPS